MTEFFARLVSRPLVLAELLGASLLINVLGLASTLYVIQVLNRYVAFGVDGTLMTLSSGLVIAALIEFSLRQIRFKLATAVSARRDWDLAMSTFETMARARPWHLARMSPAAQQGGRARARHRPASLQRAQRDHGPRLPVRDPVHRRVVPVDADGGGGGDHRRRHRPPDRHATEIRRADHRAR